MSSRALKGGPKKGQPEAAQQEEINALKSLHDANMDRNCRTSILLGYSCAVADILITATQGEHIRQQLGEETLGQMLWLQLELVEQAKATVDGYVPIGSPTYEHPWVTRD